MKEMHGSDCWQFKAQAKAYGVDEVVIACTYP